MTSASGPCEFHFRDAVCGFFEVATGSARGLLPAGVEPIERRHGRSVLTVLAFDFHGGHVGPFREVVLAIVVPPVVTPGLPMPHAAMYPFLLGTSTLRSREHGTEHYHLPHHDRDVAVRFDRSPDRVTATAYDVRPALELTVTTAAGISGGPAWRLYQVLATDGTDFHISDVVMNGRLMEHEEESGGLVLHPHDLTHGLAEADLSSGPFREQWMRDGTETFHPGRRFRSVTGGR